MHEHRTRSTTDALSRAEPLVWNPYSVTGARGPPSRARTESAESPSGGVSFHARSSCHGAWRRRGKTADRSSEARRNDDSSEAEMDSRQLERKTRRHRTQSQSRGHRPLEEIFGPLQC